MVKVLAPVLPNQQKGSCHSIFIREQSKGPRGVAPSETRVLFEFKHQVPYSQQTCFLYMRLTFVT
jgi:hypothetical protein